MSEKFQKFLLWKAFWEGREWVFIIWPIKINRRSFPSPFPFITVIIVDVAETEDCTHVTVCGVHTFSYGIRL